MAESKTTPKKGTTVATNLLGRNVCIHMHFTDKTDYQLEELRNSPEIQQTYARTNSYAGWKHLGRLCEVVAVYQDKERAVMLLLDTRTAYGLVEVYATHCRLT